MLHHHALLAGTTIYIYLLVSLPLAVKTVFLPLLEAAAERVVLGVVGVGITGVLDPPTPMGEFVAVVVSGPVGSGLGMTTLRGCSFIIAAAAARLIADKFGGCWENP